jgi:hypothetical protein
MITGRASFLAIPLFIWYIPRSKCWYLFALPADQAVTAR